MNEATTSAHPVHGDPAPNPPPTASPPDGPAFRRRTPSIRPALLVAGIALGLVLLFGIGSALTGRAPSPHHHPVAVHGTALRADPAAGPLRPIETASTPPADVLDALVLPAGSRAVSSAPWKGPTQYTQFSAKMRFRLDASEGTIVRFYEAELPARGWTVSSTGAARGQPGATEILARKASNDGWYWEVGVVVSPTTFATGRGAGSDSSGGGGTAHDTTQFSVDLFQVPDSQ